MGNRLRWKVSIEELDCHYFSQIFCAGLRAKDDPDRSQRETFFNIKRRLGRRFDFASFY